MGLSGIVQSAAPGLIGFDHSASALTLPSAQAFAAKGYKFCVRYVSRTDALRADNARAGMPDLSQLEAQAILDAGMALMVVQHPPLPGWSPSAAMGEEYGINAARYATAAGLPANVCVWLDLEGIAAGADEADIIAYCNAWFGKVSAAGFATGIYVGFDAILDADALFFDLKTTHYWKAGGEVPDVAHRGYQLVQSIKIDPITKDSFDRDVTVNDSFGGSVSWWGPS